MLVLRGFGSDAIRGDFVGTWSGSSGAGGKFRLSVGEQDGKTKCTVSFDYAGEEVKTNVTPLCKIGSTQRSKCNMTMTSAVTGCNPRFTVTRKGNWHGGHISRHSAGQRRGRRRRRLKAAPVQ